MLDRILTPLIGTTIASAILGVQRRTRLQVGPDILRPHAEVVEHACARTRILDRGESRHSVRWHLCEMARTIPLLGYLTLVLDTPRGLLVANLASTLLV